MRQDVVKGASVPLHVTREAYRQQYWSCVLKPCLEGVDRCRHVSTLPPAPNPIAPWPASKRRLRTRAWNARLKRPGVDPRRGELNHEATKGTKRWHADSRGLCGFYVFLGVRGSVNLRWNEGPASCPL